MRSLKLLSVIAVICLGSTLKAESRSPVKEISSKEIVRLLTEVSVVYETKIGAKVGFWLRLLTDHIEGQCEEGERCGTYKLIAVTSEFGESEESRAFQIVLPGEVTRVAVVSEPTLVTSEYVLSVFTSTNGTKDKCTAYSVSLRKVRLLKTPCQ